MTMKQIGGKQNKVQWNLSNPTKTGRNILCQNRQGVRLQSAKQIHRKWSNGNGNQRRIIQKHGLYRCRIRQGLLYPKYYKFLNAIGVLVFFFRSVRYLYSHCLWRTCWKRSFLCKTSLLWHRTSVFTVTFKRTECFPFIRLFDHHGYFYCGYNPSGIHCILIW